MFSASRSIKITDLNNEKVIRKIDNHAKIYSLLVVDNYFICAGDDKGNFKVWDYRVDRPVYLSLHECDEFISDLDIDSNRRVVVASSGEGTLTAFNIRSRKMEKPQSELFDSGLQCVRFVEKKNKVVVGCEDGVINIFNNGQWGNISDRFPVKQNNSGLCSIDCIEMLDEENILVIGCSDGTLQATSLFPHKPMNIFTKYDESVESLDVNQLTKQVVATSQGNVKIFSYNIDRSEKNENHKRQNVSGFFSELQQ